MRKSLASIALLGTLALTACGGSPSNTATSPSVEPLAAQTASAAAAPEAKKSPRGNLIKAIGEPAGIEDSVSKKQTVNFTVNSIAPVTCTEPYGQPVENGHLIVLDVVAETTPELGESSYPKFDISASNFQFVGASGTTFNGQLGSIATFSCIPQAETFPMQGMGPAEKVAAKVVLDVPEPTGTLIFKNLGAMKGWEYSF